MQDILSKGYTGPGLSILETDKKDSIPRKRNHSTLDQGQDAGDGENNAKKQKQTAETETKVTPSPPQSMAMDTDTEAPNTTTGTTTGTTAVANGVKAMRQSIGIKTKAYPKTSPQRNSAKKSISTMVTTVKTSPPKLTTERTFYTSPVYSALSGIDFFPNLSTLHTYGGVAQSAAAVNTPYFVNFHSLPPLLLAWNQHSLLPNKTLVTASLNNHNQEIMVESIQWLDEETKHYMKIQLKFKDATYQKSLNAIHPVHRLQLFYRDELVYTSGLLCFEPRPLKTLTVPTQVNVPMPNHNSMVTVDVSIPLVTSSASTTSTTTTASASYSFSDSPVNIESVVSSTQSTPPQRPSLLKSSVRSNIRVPSWKRLNNATAITTTTVPVQLSSMNDSPHSEITRTETDCPSSSSSLSCSELSLSNSINDSHKTSDADVAMTQETKRSSLVTDPSISSISSIPSSQQTQGVEETKNNPTKEVITTSPVTSIPTVGLSPGLIKQYSTRIHFVYTCKKCTFEQTKHGACQMCGAKIDRRHQKQYVKTGPLDASAQLQPFTLSSSIPPSSSTSLSSQTLSVSNTPASGSSSLSMLSPMSMSDGVQQQQTQGSVPEQRTMETFSFQIQQWNKNKFRNRVLDISSDTVLRHHHDQLDKLADVQKIQTPYLPTYLRCNSDYYLDGSDAALARMDVYECKPAHILTTADIRNFILLFHIVLPMFRNYPDNLSKSITFDLIQKRMKIDGLIYDQATIFTPMVTHTLNIKTTSTYYGPIRQIISGQVQLPINIDVSVKPQVIWTSNGPMITVQLTNLHNSGTATIKPIANQSHVFEMDWK